MSCSCTEVSSFAIGGCYVQVSSQVMLQASDLWRTLKPAQIKPLFEAEDVALDGHRGLKRARGQ